MTEDLQSAGDLSEQINVNLESDETTASFTRLIFDSNFGYAGQTLDDESEEDYTFTLHALGLQNDFRRTDHLESQDGTSITTLLYNNYSITVEHTYAKQLVHHESQEGTSVTSLLDNNYSETLENMPTKQRVHGMSDAASIQSEFELSQDQHHNLTPSYDFGRPNVSLLEHNYSETLENTPTQKIVDGSSDVACKQSEFDPRLLPPDQYQNLTLNYGFEKPDVSPLEYNYRYSETLENTPTKQLVDETFDAASKQSEFEPGLPSEDQYQNLTQNYGFERPDVSLSDNYSEIQENSQTMPTKQLVDGCSLDTASKQLKVEQGLPSQDQHQNLTANYGFGKPDVSLLENNYSEILENMPIKQCDTASKQSELDPGLPSQDQYQNLNQNYGFGRSDIHIANYPSTTYSLPPVQNFSYSPSSPAFYPGCANFPAGSHGFVENLNQYQYSYSGFNTSSMSTGWHRNTEYQTPHQGHSLNFNPATMGHAISYPYGTWNPFGAMGDYPSMMHPGIPLIKKKCKPKNSELARDPGQGSGDFLCIMCAAQFESSQYLKDHMRKHLRKQGRSTVCPICSRIYNTRPAFIKHAVECHSYIGNRKPQAIILEDLPKSEENKASKPSKVFTCSYCSRPLKTLQSKLQHEERHLGDKPFLCIKCPCNFATQEQLDAHVETHNNYKCNYCERTFCSESDLIHHETEDHKDILASCCLYCQKTFRSERARLVHFAKHHLKKE